MNELINGFWTTLQTLLSWVLDGFLYVIKTAVWFILDGFLTTVYAFVNLLDISSVLFDMAAYWGLLPPQLVYIINQIGLPMALTMLMGCYVIRMLLNLIPAAFTRI